MAKPQAATPDLTQRRWRVAWTHKCVCRHGPCYWTAEPGRHYATSFLNNGEHVTRERAAAHLTDHFRQEDVQIVKIWLESPQERDTRVAARRKERRDAERGVHWSMGGAN